MRAIIGEGRTDEEAFWHEAGTRRLINAHKNKAKVLTWTFVLERVTRIELALSAWEATALQGVYGL
ncbi:hypothetical protein GCM10023080_017990 [Streptomyces pseudoechinosporeus]